MNPKDLPFVNVLDIYNCVEMLVRGIYTMEPTLISQKFAKSFCLMMNKQDCLEQ